MRPNFASRRAQRGVTLIELMVAMVLGLLLLGAVLQFYLANKASFTAQDQNGYLQESGRYALGYIQRDVRMAGLTGCRSRQAPGTNLPLVNHLNSTNYAYALFTGVRGFNANGTTPGATYAITATDPANSSTASDWTPALPTGTNALSGKVVPGSDVLVVSLTSPATPLVDPFIRGANVKVQAGHTLTEGEIALITDCQQAELFQITNINDGGTTVVGSAASYTPGNAAPITESDSSRAKDFRRGSEIASVRTYVYYVGRSPSNNRPALFRAGLRVSGTGVTLADEELINGVDSMQVTYGLDSNDDFVVDSYVSAGAATDWSKVRAVRVALLVRSPDEFLPSADAATYALSGTTVDPVNDRRQRRVFQSTIALRNRLL